MSTKTVFTGCQHSKNNVCVFYTYHLQINDRSAKCNSNLCFRPIRTASNRSVSVSNRQQCRGGRRRADADDQVKTSARKTRDVFCSLARPTTSLSQMSNGTQAKVFSERETPSHTTQHGTPTVVVPVFCTETELEPCAQRMRSGDLSIATLAVLFGERDETVKCWPNSFEADLLQCRLTRVQVPK